MSGAAKTGRVRNNLLMKSRSSDIGPRGVLLLEKKKAGAVGIQHQRTKKVPAEGAIKKNGAVLSSGISSYHRWGKK